MAQAPESYVKKDESVHLIPTASVAINPGDVVVMSRKNDPASLALLNATAGRIRPISTAWHGKWAVGVADAKFTEAVVGSTDYASPDADNALKVIREGVHRLAIVQTSGKAGDLVRFSSGASGAQLFRIDNKNAGFAIGRIYKDFSGATANDPQYVELIKHPLGGPNLYWFLENRVIDGCWVKAGPGTNSNVAVAFSTTTSKDSQNVIILQNKVFTLADDPTLPIGGVATHGAQSAISFKWVVARSGAFAIRSASGVHSAFASFTNSGVSVGMMVPVTMTGGEIPVALLIRWSAGVLTIGRIKNLRGPSMIPNVGNWGV